MFARTASPRSTMEPGAGTTRGVRVSHQEPNDPWEATPEQKVLDTALAWAVTNKHFDVADFLVAHGADINTRWNSHEPASILHHLVFYGSHEAMQWVIDRGIDMTIEDYRWRATARGWALHAKRDERMAQWLADAERLRASVPASGRSGSPLRRC